MLAGVLFLRIYFNRARGSPVGNPATHRSSISTSVSLISRPVAGQHHVHHPPHADQPRYPHRGATTDKDTAAALRQGTENPALGNPDRNVVRLIPELGQIWTLAGTQAKSALPSRVHIPNLTLREFSGVNIGMGSSRTSSREGLVSVVLSQQRTYAEAMVTAALCRQQRTHASQRQRCYSITSSRSQALV